MPTGSRPGACGFSRVSAAAIFTTGELTVSGDLLTGILGSIISAGGVVTTFDGVFFVTFAPKAAACS